MNYSVEKYHLKSSSFWECLSKEDRLYLKKKAIRKEYSKGDFLFKEKEYSKGIYVVKKGKIKIFKTNSDGRQSIVYIYKKTDYFGYRPLLAEESHPVSAMAMDNVVVSFISGEVFRSVLNQSPNLARQLLIILSKEFTVWINKLTIFSQYGVKKRLALALLILEKVYENNASSRKHVSISISRDDLAGYVGTAKETLVRMLRTFKDQKILTTKGSKINIIKKRALIDIVSEI